MTARERSREGRPVDEVHAYVSRAIPGDDFVHLLDDVERASLAVIRAPRDRDRYLSAHVLMRRVLAEHTGIAEDEQRFHRRCIICGGPHGKPRLVPPGVDPFDENAISALDTPQINLSYAGNRVMLALRQQGAIGVDIEAWAMTDFVGFPSVALTAEESRELLEFGVADRAAARTAWWCRKEAVLKATGHGLRVEAVNLRVTPPDTPPALLAWNDPTIPRPDVTMADVPVEGRYAAAVAVEGRVTLRVHLHDVDHLARV
ncbi:4'-phosphopantetheinyl transferase family protein [Mobilicoccus massiliensis]|uniref:4'-phosphopantetheinyl transferase family protein n=1 Tax=Mobilicoccus massiliensis TaxID=1522310 RepID=UPI00058EC700|nr:4'-phosphopantetheinyl transferase superfamily protein [Mobilicoccus massiliensis]